MAGEHVTLSLSKVLGRSTETSRRGSLLHSLPALLGLMMLVVGLVLSSAAAFAQDENLILNPDFSLGIDDEGIPLHWVNFGGSELNSFELAKDRASVGEVSLRFNDDDPEGSAGLRSHNVPAKAGDRFLLHVDAFVERGTGMVYMDFHDAQGRRIEAVTVTQGVTSDWETLTVEGTAPAGTDHVTIILYVNIPNTGVAYFDNVRLYSR